MCDAGLLTPRGTDNLCGRVWAHLWVHTRPHTRNKNNNIVQKATLTEDSRQRCPPRMPRAVLRFEEAGGQRLPLGGRHGYLGVRGKQGRKKDKFQGTTPKKQHRTGLCDTPLEAAIAFAQLREDLELDMYEARGKKRPQPPASNAASKKAEVGVYLGHLLQQQRTDVLRVWGAPLSQQQAGALAARGVVVAYAEVLA